MNVRGKETLNERRVPALVDDEIRHRREEKGSARDRQYRGDDALRARSPRQDRISSRDHLHVAAGVHHRDRERCARATSEARFEAGIWNLFWRKF